MGETAERLAFGAVAVGEDLRNEHPNNRPLAHGVRGDERKDAPRHNGVVLREKRPCCQPQRRDIAKRADVEQRAPAEPVNQPEAHEGEDQVGDANADGLEQCGFLAQAAHLENARREVEHRVDTGELIEEGDQDREEDRNAQTPGPELGGDCLLGMCRRHQFIRVGLELGLRKIRFNQFQHLEAGPTVALAANQPARAFGNAETHSRVNDRGNGRDTQHPAPGVLAPHPGDHRIGKEGDDDAENNVELEHARQPPAIGRRRNLGNVKRSGDRRDANAESADKAGGDEHAHSSGKTTANRRHDIEHTDEKEGGFAAKPVGGPAAEQ